MKKIKFLLLAASACVFFAGFTAKAVNIMPMGDSVTARGGTPESSYRYWLYTYLVNAGYQNIIFVGNQYGVSDGPPANSNFDQHYEGGATPGPDAWTSASGVAAIGDANSRQPNVVLLDLGSNDFRSGDDMTSALATTKANLKQIIEGLRAANSSVVILLAQPTPWLTSAKDERKFQSKLAGIVSQVAKEEGVIKVNLFGGFSAKNDTKDGTHPNVRGEQKIAKKFFSALKRVL